MFEANLELLRAVLTRAIGLLAAARRHADHTSAAPHSSTSSGEHRAAVVERVDGRRCRPCCRSPRSAGQPMATTSALPERRGAQRRAHGRVASTGRSPTRPRARSARAPGRGAGCRRRTTGRRRTRAAIRSAARAPPRRTTITGVPSASPIQNPRPGISGSRAVATRSRHDQSGDPLGLHARPGRLGPIRRTGNP